MNIWENVLSPPEYYFCISLNAQCQLSYCTMQRCFPCQQKSCAMKEALGMAVCVILWTYGQLFSHGSQRSMNWTHLASCHGHRQPWTELEVVMKIIANITLRTSHTNNDAAWPCHLVFTSFSLVQAQAPHQVHQVPLLILYSLKEDVIDYWNIGIMGSFAELNMDWRCFRRWWVNIELH